MVSSVTELPLQLQCDNRGRIPDMQYTEFLHSCREEFNQRISEPCRQGKMDDFIKYKIFASGGFGLVLLVQHAKTEDFYAMKALEKKALVVNERISYAKSEKTILQGVSFPFLVNMNYFLYDTSYLYFVMPFLSGGELYTLIADLGPLTEQQSKFYAAQVVLALEYLHFLDVIYRDLKPENILLDKDGYLKVTDFGTSKIVQKRTWTVCGTPEYIAPEIYLQKGYGKAVDWWSLGVLLFEMNSKYSPFYGKDDYSTYKKVLESNISFPNHFSNALKDLVKHLLERDLSKRYGNLVNGAIDIKNHKWFSKINWLNLFHKNVTPPIKPKIKQHTDTSNFYLNPGCTYKVDPYDPYEHVFSNF